jgi:uncharacterized SAM-binding protein YcdF (DUF218 family)
MGVAAAWLASVVSVVAWGMRDGAVRSDAIVVLGAAQYAGRPSPVLRARLDHAVALWKRDLAPWLVLTGGTGAGDTTSEAAVSRRYVLRQGIPDSIILLENHGRTTSASLEAVSNMLSTRRLNQAILVSDPFHMLRLRIIAGSFGLRSVTSPTRTSPISSSRSKSLGYILSESVKVPMILILSALRSHG